MSICNLEQNKKLANAIANHINLHIKKNLKTTEPFRLLDIVNEIYDNVYKKNQDRNQALGIAGAVPQVFIALLKIKPEYITELSGKNLKLDPIFEFQKEIETSEKPLDVVAKYIKQGAVPTVKQVIDNRLNTDPVEKKVIKEAEAIPAYSDKKITGNAFTSTTGSNQVERNGKKVIDESDVNKKASYSALQGLLLAQTDQDTFEDLEYNGKKGFRLVAVTEGQLPNPEKNVYSERKDSITTVVAITDLEGNYIYFDNNGKITTEDKGKIAYFPLRSTSAESKAQLLESSLVKERPFLEADTIGNPEEFESRLAAQRKAFEKQIDGQARLIDNIKEKVKAGEKVALNITGGVIGFIDDKNATEKPLSEYNLSDKEKANAGKQTTSYNVKGVSFAVPAIKFDNYNKLIGIKGLPVEKATPDLLKSLIDLLVDNVVKPDGKLVSPEEKVDIFKQFIEIKEEGQKKLYNKLFLSKGPEGLVIFTGNDFVSLANKEQAKDTLKNFLTKYAYHTYIKNPTNTYKSFTITNNTLNTKEEPYNDFIFKYLVPRVAFDKNTKRPMINNGYLTFELADIKEQVADKAKEVVKEAKEEIKKSNYNTDDLADLLERSKLIESRSTAKQKEAAEKWWNESTLSKALDSTGKPLITLNLLRNVVNSDAWATFGGSAITLYKGGDYTHMYHEAWHAFSQMYLTKAERDKLYAEAAKKEGSFDIIKKIPGPGGNSIQKVKVKFSEATRKELEEHIAEDFREFAMNNGKFKQPYKGMIAKIFRKIWQALKALFKGTSPANVEANPSSQGYLTEMFEKLYNAKGPEDLNMYMPSINNAEFGTLNSGVFAENGEMILSAIEADLISRSIDGIISEVTTDLIVNKNKPGAAMQIFAGTKVLDKLYNVTIKNAITDRLAELVEDKKANEDTWNELQKDYHLNKINILQKTLDNFGNVVDILENKTDKSSVVGYHLQNSAFAGRIREAIQEPTDISESSSNDVMARNDKKANDVESEKLATASATYILQSLVQQEYNSNKTRRVNKLNDLGFPQTIEFKPFWNFLMNKVGGEQNEVDLYNKILEVKNKKISPLFDQLLEKIGNPEKVMTANKISADIWLGMVRSLNLARINLHNNVFQEEEEGGITALSGKVSADYFNIKNKIWPSKFNLQTGAFVTLNSDKQNQLNLAAITEKFLTNPKNSEERIIDSEGVLRYDIKPGQDAVQFLNAIGIYMSDNFMVKDSIDSTAIKYIADAIGQAYFNQIPIVNPVKFLSDARAIRVQKLIGGRLEIVETDEENKPYKIESNATRVNDLALIEAEYSTEYSSQMKPLPDGNKKSIYSLNSSTTRMVSAINHADNVSQLDDKNSDYGIVPHLNYVKNPAVMGSITKKSLFDITGAKIEGREIIQVELVGSQYKAISGLTEGLSHGKMTDSDKFVSDLQSTLSSGSIEAVRSGEKSTYSSLRANKIVTSAAYKKKADYLYFDTEDFLLNNQGKSITGVRVNDFLNEVMFNKLEGELRRIQKINNGITEEEAVSLGLKASEAKDFYKKNVKGFENGGKFDWFDDILESKEYGATLKEQLIDLYSNRLSTDNTLESLLVETEEGKALKNNIEKEIGLYFKALADEFKEQNYNKIFGAKLPEFLKKLATKNLTEAQKALVTDANIIDGLMMSFAVNTAIHSDEMLLLVFGDGFQFNHTKDESTKRVPTYNSPGIVFSTGQFSLAAINQYYSRGYEAKLIADGTVTERTQPRLFKKVGDKAIIKESVVKAARYAEYDELFRNTLSKRDYTEDQINKLLYGNGTFDNPGGGSIMETWAEIKDADGQGYVSFDYYRMLKANENNWTNAQEQAYQKIINGEFIGAEELTELFPVYKLQYAGPLATDGTIYPIQSIDKFSLLPLIPTLIEGTRLDTIHKAMINQGVDYVLFDSGAKRSYIKSGKTNGDDIFEGNDTSKLKQDFKFTKNPFYVEYLKNQTEVNREFKEESRLSTQFRKLFDVTLYENGKPVDYQEGKESLIEKKTKAVLDELERLTKYMRKDLLEEMGWEEVDGKVQGDIEDLISYIKDKLKKQGYTDHEISAIETDNGKVDLSTSPVAPRLERFLFSIVNNKLVRIKTKGEPLVQASAAFFQKFSKPTAEQTKEYDDFGTNGLRGYVVDPVGELNAKGERVYKNTKAVRVKIALTENYENLYMTNYFTKDESGNYVKTEDTIAVYNTDGSLNQEESFKRLNEMVQSDAWLESDNNRKKIQLTGVRIPVQGANSTEFAEIWEFLPPAAGSIIIIPAEIVAKSGGDFDVDKLTMYIKYITKRGSLLEDNVETPEMLDKKIKEYKTKLKDLNANMLDIVNSLDDFRKAVKRASNFVPMTLEQKKSFLEQDDKKLLQTLSVKENQDFLQKSLKNAYKIYKSEISSYPVGQIENTKKQINSLAGKSSNLAEVFNTLSNLREHKRNFTASVQNTLVDNIIQVLQMPQMAFSLLLPNGTYLAKPYADELEDIVRTADKEVDYKKSIKTGEKVTGISKGVSPSVTRNYNYNKKKQQDNTTGKDILGPIVLEIPINNLLNKAGALLNPSIKEVITEKGQPVEVNTPITLELKHNAINGRISMSNLLDADNKNQIADVLSQLANGAVDVGKDAWIAYLQGNLEAIPKILFLLETGVPIAEVAYFMNNPLIREYIKTSQKAKSKLAKVFYGPQHKQNKMIGDYVTSIIDPVIKSIDPQLKANIKTLNGKYTLLKKYIEQQGVDAFGKETLKRVATNKGSVAENTAGFLEYLYIEQIVKEHDQLKKAVDVDNNVSGDNAEVQAKLEELSKAEELQIFDPSTLKHIKEESTVSSFFIQDFVADLFGERFFSFRANPVLEKFVRDVQSSPKKMAAIKEITGLNKENFPTRFKNALTLNIFTNALAQYKKGNTDYKGVAISDLLNEQSAVKNIDQAVDDFKTRKYLESNKSNEGYRLRGLYPISEMYTQKFTADDFVELTLEREYLRKQVMPLTDTLKESIEFKQVKQKFEKSGIPSITSLSDENLNKLVHEYMLLHQALLNTYNNHEMFSSGDNTVAKKLIDIINNYPDLNYKYGSLLQRFTLDALQSLDRTNPRRNFKLKANSDISKPEATEYHRMWKELANPSMPKLSGSTEADLAANKYISDFFAQLPTFAFLQSGMDAGQFSMNNVMPTDNFKPIMDRAAKDYTDKVLNGKNADTILSGFLSLFMVNNSVSVSILKGRGLNYKQSLGESYNQSEIAKTIEKAVEENAQKAITDLKVLAANIAQSIESTEAGRPKDKLINNEDISRFKAYLEKTKGVLPKEFFTASTRFKIFYNTEAGRRESAPQTSKWLLNTKNLYDLVDKESGEVYLENVNLETGYQEVSDIIPTQSSITISPSEFTNYSGAAVGSDQEWAKIGKEFGIGKQVDYTPQTLQKLSEKQRKEVETAYQQAVKDLGRKALPYNWSSPQKEDYSGGLVRRDYLQAKSADAVFAIGTIVKPGDKNKEGYTIKSKTESVDGGTGYAVQMAINLGKPVYVYDQVKKGWYEWNGSIFVQTFIPTLTPKFAGVGTRGNKNAEGKYILSEDIKQAIRNVYINTFNKVAQPTDTNVAKQKASAIKSIKDGIKDYRLDEILAEKGYDVQDFISNLEAATTQEEVNNIINKILKQIC
jgi:hypothetical protein